MGPLHKAAKNGLVDDVLRLLRQEEIKSTQLNSYDEEGFTPLLYAAQKGDLEITSQLLAAGAAVDLRQGPDEDGPPALFFAVFGGFLSIVNRLIAAGASVDIRFKFWNEQGYTPLLVAARRSPEVALCLLAAGADPKVASSNNLTTVHAAVLGNSPKLLKKLLEKGVAIDEQCREEIFSSSGATALHLAATHSHDLQTVMTLVKNGANVNLKNGHGRTPLHRAVCCGAINNVELLIVVGADINAQDIGGQTALHLAVHGGHVKITEMLIQYGADLNLGCVGGEEHLYEGNRARGMTALHIAAKKGSLDVVERLLAQENMSINAVDSFLRTPLHVATQYDHADIVVKLLAAGAAIEAGCMMLSYSTPGHEDVSLHGATPLHIAACEKKLDIAEILLSNGASANALAAPSGFHDGEGFTPLFLAANDEGSGALVDRLLAGGAFAEVIVGQDTLLDYACEVGSADVVRKLLAAGACADGLEWQDSSPLHIAAASTIDTTAKLEALLESGADINALDDDHCSVLHHLVENENHTLSPVAVSILLAAGADVQIQGAHGRTALQAAYEHLVTGDFSSLDEENDMKWRRTVVCPTMALLVAAGDYSWDSVPNNCPGLEKVLVKVAKEAPNELPALFERLEPPVKEVVQATLRVLHRCLPCEWQLRMDILGHVLSSY